MKRASRNISWIHLVAVAAVCFVFVTEAHADQLIANEFQATSSGDLELTPTLGSDNGVAVLVYTRINISTFSSRVFYQHLNDTGTFGAAIGIGDGLTNDNLNDVHGNHIVYTATQLDMPGVSQIRKHRISDGSDTHVSGFGEMGESRIHGRWIAWIEDNRVFLIDRTDPRFDIVIAGPTPAASQLEIGDTFVVWHEDGENIWAYDLGDGTSALVNPSGSNPATNGSWVVWQSNAGVIKGLNVDTRATVTLGDINFVNANPSIDGNNITWESNAAGNYDIYLHRIAEGDTFQLTTDPADQQLASVFGNQVAYMDNRASTVPGPDLDIWVSTFSFGPDPVPDIAVAPLNFNFGNVEVGSTSSTIVTICNEGDVDLTVTSLSLQSGANYAFSSASGFPAVIPPGVTVDVMVTFTPMGEGAVADVLEINSDDPDESLVSVTLNGTGVAITDPPSQQIADIIMVIEDGIITGNITPEGPGNSGPGRLGALINMIGAADDLITDGLIAEACQQLLDAFKRTDGLSGRGNPPDFISGADAALVAELIQGLRTDLGCQ